MKKLPLLVVVLLCLSVSSCRHNDKNISISYSNSDQYYSMKAYFSKYRTRDVEDYMDRKIGRKSNLSFAHSRIDADVILDDHSSFYIYKSPGVLKIKLDKEKNSQEAYEMIKAMCEGIKPIVIGAK